MLQCASRWNLLCTMRALYIIHYFCHLFSTVQMYNSNFLHTPSVQFFTQNQELFPLRCTIFTVKHSSTSKVESPRESSTTLFHKSTRNRVWLIQGMCHVVMPFSHSHVVVATGSGQSQISYNIVQFCSTCKREYAI